MRIFVLLLAVAAVGLGAPCEDPEYTCDDTATCCKLEDGSYGCCPYPQAVCCADNVHCCPSGYECDTEEGKCNSALHGKQVFFAKKKQATRRTTGDVPCADGQSRCPTGTTCCQLSSGQYGCCPTAHGTCCSDHLHCCPDGFRCDTTGERCYQKQSSSNSFIESLRNFPATIGRPKESIEFERPHELESQMDRHKYPVQCGKGWGCSRQSTCCVEFDDESGLYPDYVCCPLSGGVCCRHSCCPRGYQCQDNNTCVKKVKMFENFFS